MSKRGTRSICIDHLAPAIAAAAHELRAARCSATAALHVLQCGRHGGLVFVAQWVTQVVRGSAGRGQTAEIVAGALSIFYLERDGIDGIVTDEKTVLADRLAERVL